MVAPCPVALDAAHCRRWALWLAVAMAAAASASATPAAAQGPTAAPLPTWEARARVIATGLGGVQGLRQVGRFHHGGAIPGNPSFALHTQPGRVLAANRLLVALADNRGLPLAAPGQAAGAVLSIDPDAATAPLQVPPVLRPGQGGPVQLYSAQSGDFVNGRYNPGALTAPWPAVAGPRHLSINNAFGRPWIANAPHGDAGPGSLSVTDPDGAPLAHAPSSEAGGVFAAALTPRRSEPLRERMGLTGPWFNRRDSGQRTPGSIDQGLAGTAFLGPSPDGSGFAVFAAVRADGALLQVHVQDGVDGLAPPGTVRAAAAGGVLGLAFRWVPLPALFVADPGRDRVRRLDLAHDGRHFKLARVHDLSHPALREPVDLVPAVPEIANPRFASHTTLAGGSDLYVLNRGDGSVLRIDERGHAQARLVPKLPDGRAPGPGRLVALAVSADAMRLWVSIDGSVGTGGPGAVLELPAFDADGPFHEGGPPGPAPPPLPATEALAAFMQTQSPAQGLGPCFNARSCLQCHDDPGPGGMSTRDGDFVRRVALMDPASGRVLPLPGAEVAHRQLLGRPGELPLPRAANVVSLRMPPSLLPVARLDDIPDEVIRAQAVARGDGVQGRVHEVRAPDGRLRPGRYGWKADAATLEQMVALALDNELGISTPGRVPAGAMADDDGSLLRRLVDFVRGLRPPGGAGP